MLKYQLARENMVDGQLRPNKVNEPAVIARFLSIPRELFVASHIKQTAYADQPAQMDHGREMFSPLVCARLVQALHFQEDDRVLVVAAGTGYTCAILSGLVHKIYAVEEDKTLLDAARNAFIDLKIENVELVSSPPQNGYKKAAPYDKILIDAPVGDIPQALVNQLRQNGKLGAVREGKDGLLEATVFTKINNTLFEEPLFETKGVVLSNFAKQESFVF